MLTEGIHKISVSEYDALDAVRSSRLSDMANTSPKHLRYRLVHADEDEQDRLCSDAFQVGSAIHMAVLEPDRYRLGADHVVFRAGAGRKSEKYKAFAAQHAGKIILLEKDLDVVRDIAAAVMSDPIASEWLDPLVGREEMTMVWQDTGTGEWCKMRVDKLGADGSPPVITDLKSARDASADKTARLADELLYQLRWAMYWSGFCAVSGGTIPTMREVVVEKEPPYDVVCYELDDSVIEAGMTLYRTALDTYAACKRSGVWPGKGGGKVQTLELKRWARGVQQEQDLADVEVSDA